MEESHDGLVTKQRVANGGHEMESRNGVVKMSREMESQNGITKMSREEGVTKNDNLGAYVIDFPKGVRN